MPCPAPIIRVPVSPSASADQLGPVCPLPMRWLQTRGRPQGAARRRLARRGPCGTPSEPSSTEGGGGADVVKNTTPLKQQCVEVTKGVQLNTAGRQKASARPPGLYVKQKQQRPLASRFKGRGRRQPTCLSV